VAHLKYMDFEGIVHSSGKVVPVHFTIPVPVIIAPFHSPFVKSIDWLGGNRIGKILCRTFRCPVRRLVAGDEIPDQYAQEKQSRVTTTMPHNWIPIYQNGQLDVEQILKFRNQCSSRYPERSIAIEGRHIQYIILIISQLIISNKDRVSRLHPVSH
jgi:hypothetical protein